MNTFQFTYQVLIESNGTREYHHETQRIQAETYEHARQLLRNDLESRDGYVGMSAGFGWEVKE